MIASPTRNPISTRPRTEKSRRDAAAPAAAGVFPVLSTTAMDLHCQFFGRLARIFSRIRVRSAQRHLPDEPGEDKTDNGQNRGDQEHRVGSGRDRVLEAVDQIRLSSLKLLDLGRGQLAE